MSHIIADLGIPDATAASHVLRLILIRSRAKLASLKTGPSVRDGSFEGGRGCDQWDIPLANGWLV